MLLRYLRARQGLADRKRRKHRFLPAAAGAAISTLPKYTIAFTGRKPQEFTLSWNTPVGR
jgi:hypothetical protein